MKKPILLALAFLAVLLAARLVLVPKMVENGFARLAAQIVGVDQTQGLQDGLHVYVCGAGSPLFDPKRSGPCIGVLAGDKAFVFDAGAYGSQNLAPMGFPLVRTEEIFLTHLHSDHIDGLGQMLLGTWIASGRTQPVQVSGPAGTAQVVAGFNSAYRIDSAHRTEHHGARIANPASFGARAREISLNGKPKIVYDKGGVKITAYAVSHEPVAGAFGYRVDYKDRSISISGDTAYDPFIATTSKDVDVLFHEAMNMEMVKTLQAAATANGAAPLAKILSDIREYHTSPVDAARTAQAANAKALVLVHIVPALPSDALVPLFVKGADKEFGRKITVAEDGTIVRLPAGSEAVIYENGM